MAKSDARGMDDDEEEAVPAKSGSKKLLIMILGGVLLLGVSIAGTVVVTKALLGGADTEAESADAASDTANDKTDKKKKKKGKKGEKGDKSAKEEIRPAMYIPLEPPFVVNSEAQAGIHYLQVSIEVMTHDPLVAEDVKTHMPNIRNNLILLLSSQTQAAVATREGKERVRSEALAEVQKVLKERTGKPGVEALYFTNFVMQ
jgi:flagellar FliL protein